MKYLSLCLAALALCTSGFVAWRQSLLVSKIEEVTHRFEALEYVPSHIEELEARIDSGSVRIKDLEFRIGESEDQGESHGKMIEKLPETWRYLEGRLLEHDSTLVEVAEKMVEFDKVVKDIGLPIVQSETLHERLRNLERDNHDRILEDIRER